MGGRKDSQVSVRFIFLIAVLLSSVLVVSAINSSIYETNLSSQKPNFSISLDKESYSVLETVKVSVLPPETDYLIKVFGPIAEYVLDIFFGVVSYG